MSSAQTFRVDLADPAQEAELAAFYADCPTSVAQQTPAWSRVIRDIGVDQPLILGCRQKGALVGALPSYRFEGPLGAILTSCAQAGPLGGVACTGDAERVYPALLQAFAELATAQGCAVATVITNPFWPDRDAVSSYFEADYVLENSCQVLDLRDDLDASGAFLHATANLRRNLRKAQSGSLRIDAEQSSANVDAWYAIHEERHREIGATPLPKSLFTGALEHMIPADKGRFFFVRRVDSGEMVAGGFYVYHGAVIDALMPSLRTRHAALAPNFLLAQHSMEWARKRGLRFYNWEPSPPESGVYRFKKQWGSRDFSYAYLSQVTGNIEPFLQSSPAELQSHYPWHYVIPFDRIGDTTAPRGSVSSRRGAWNAAGEPR